MTPEEIEQNNILISEFMGNRREVTNFQVEHEHSSGEYDYIWVEDEVWVDEHGHLLNYDNPEYDELHYYSHWEWIMPVVEKIRVEHRFSFDIGNDASVTKRRIHQVDVYDNWLGGGETIVCSIQGEKLIQVIYEGVVAFVKWYNEKSPSPIQN